MNEQATKTIALTKDEINLAYAIVRVMEVNKTKLDPLHQQISAKLHQAKHNLFAGITTLSLSDAERHVLRHYNMNYCEILGENLRAHDEKCIADYCKAASDQLEIYARATRLQLQFSSSNR